MFPEIERSPTPRKIVEIVMKLISDGKLKPGQALPPERVLAEQLNVSRVALREAIASLGVLGVVEKRWGMGNFISQNVNMSLVENFTRHIVLSRQLEIFDVMEARLVLECEVAALAAARVTDEDVAKLTMVLNEFLQTSRKSFRRIEIDRKLHNAIAKVARNEFLESLQGAIMGRVFEVIKITTRLGSAYEATEEEHKKIVDAIVSRNVSGARRAMFEHLVNATERIFTAEGEVEPEIGRRLDCLRTKILKTLKDADGAS